MRTLKMENEMNMLMFVSNACMCSYMFNKVREKPVIV